MRKCMFCVDAITDLQKEDTDRKDLLFKRVFIPTGWLDFSVNISAESDLEFYAIGYSAEIEILNKRKIRYCPMCGRKLPYPTPTMISREAAVNE